MANWKELLTECLENRGESWDDVIDNTMTEEEMTKEFDEMYGVIEGIPFTVWTTERVYFPACYNGAEWVASVSRHLGSQDEAGYKDDV